ncbi:GAF domain-containing protein [Desulfospira joergensenii]|uniref:GAF domain-containing protein n=1 Tax=Desulfospira joergensenii TaxID=53329 RepID=UPI0003B70773|nr:GAF domain-containing protein [Desulfospira joergensenii]
MKDEPWKPLPERDHYESLGILLEISEALVSTRNLDELYRAIHASLGKIFPVNNFCISLFNEDRDTLTFAYRVDEKEKCPPDIPHLSRTASLTGEVIQSCQPIIFYEKDIIEFARQRKSEVIGQVSKVWLGAPLIIRDRVIGAMVIQDYHSADTYQPRDLELLDSVSRYVALAIERKESEEKINRQSLVLEKILESSPVGIALVEDRVFKWVNQEMVRMFRYESKQDFQDKSSRMIYKNLEDYELAGDIIHKELTSHGISDYEIEVVRKDKTTFPANIRLNSSDTKDPMNWTIAIVTDISQRRASEKETAEKERLQGVLEMAGAVCHEINQPLQAIIGFSDLLLLGTEDEETVDRGLNAIKSQADRLGRITQKLSNITRYKTVEYPGNKTIVDIWNAGSESNN